MRRTVNPYLRLALLILWGLFCYLTCMGSASFPVQVAMPTITWCVAMAEAVSRSRGVVSLPSIYLLLLGLFHLGLVVPIALGAEPTQTLAWVESTYIGKALGLCAVAFALFAGGTILGKQSLRTAKFRGRGEGNVVATSNGGNRTLLVGGITLGLLSTVLLYVGVIVNALFSISRAMAYAPGALRSGLFGFFFLLPPMSAVIAATGATKHQIRYVVGGFLLVFFPLFLLGYRGHWLVYFAAVLALWHKKDKPRAVAVGTFILAIVIILSPVIKVTRGNRAITYGEALPSISFLSLPMEMGGSLRPLVETLSVTEEPGSKGYWYGKSYLIAMRVAIPKTIRSAIGLSREEDIDAPAKWITWVAEPLTFYAGGGIGYSGIAEPYLNFGIVGVILFFVLLGYILVRCERAFELRPFQNAMLMVGFAALLWTTRNDFTNLLRPLVWAIFYVYLLRVVAGTMKRSDGGSAPMRAREQFAASCEPRF